MHSRALPLAIQLLSASLILAALDACVSSPPREPARDSEPPTSTVIAEAEPARSPSPITEPTNAGEPPTSAAVCDEYLVLYERCEEHLKPQIMAGDRRFAHAERAWIEHIAQTPEAATLPGACSSMLDALRVDCPEQHRTPLTTE